MEFMAQTPDGKPVPFVIKEVKDEDITIDFNHPLAGKNLKFDVELIDVRDATKEELAHGHVHGAGGHHH
jgi:FKBP-type peptidyl-prolyl cis-trans isomerase SlyD